MIDADTEWLDGYRDGGKSEDAVAPSSNRSESYRLGWRVRRAEIETGNPLACAADLRIMAEEAAQKDAAR
jgi:hypothetical protein